MTNANTKQFHIGDILSITTGVLISPRKMDGVYDILNYMTGDNLFTHQLPRAGRECAPWLLRQHPQLARAKLEAMTPEAADACLAGMVRLFGERLPVEPIPKDDHIRRNPIEELVEMVGKDRVVVVKAAGKAK